MARSRTWLVIGASGGIGFPLAEAVALAGDNVVVCACSRTDMPNLASRHAVSFTVDADDPVQAQRIIGFVVESFGGFDVLAIDANCEPITEEGSDNSRMSTAQPPRWTCDVVDAAICYLRRQRSGHVVWVSAAGQLTIPRSRDSLNSTRIDDEHFEVFARELSPFGIHATAVEPCGFRTRESTFSTGFLAAASVHSERLNKNTTVRRVRGERPCNRAWAVAAIIRLVGNPSPPLRLVIVAGATASIESKAWSRISGKP